MNYLKKLEELITKQNGTVLSRDLDEYGIPRTYLSLMVSKGNLERSGRGIYKVHETIEDEMFIMQKKYPKLIFSHETALYLYELSDRNPFEYSATVPSGTKIVDKISNRFKIYYIKKEHHELGSIEKINSFGNLIKVYNIERTICDLIRSKHRIDLQIFSDAMKKISNKKFVDYYLMNQYSKELKVEKKLKTYMEVLL